MKSYLSQRKLQSCCCGLDNLFLTNMFLLTDHTAGTVFQPYKAYVPIISSSNLLAFKIRIRLGIQKEPPVSCCLRKLRTYTHGYMQVHIHTYIHLYNVKHNPVTIPNQKIF